MVVPDIIKGPVSAMVMGTVISLPIMLVKPSSAAVCATTIMTMDMVDIGIIPMVDIDIISTNLVGSGIRAAGITKVTADTPEVTVEDITADEKTHYAALSINDFPLGVSSPAYPIGNGLLPPPDRQ